MNDRDIFIATDQPECCRKCGTRVEILAEKDCEQLVSCPTCNYTYSVHDK